MPIPYDTIHLNIKEKRITRVSQLFEYGTLLEWKEETGFRKGVLEGLIADPRKYKWVHAAKLSLATGLKQSTVERLIREQRRYNWAIKKAAGQKEERQEPRPKE